MTKDVLYDILGDEIEDPDEEHFILFSTPIPSSNLGFLSSTSAALAVTVDSDELTIYQSPGLLTSNASFGTTGAVLWRISPLVAEWLLIPDNFLFKEGVLTAEGGRNIQILELGCGIAGVIASTLGRRVNRYVATDLDSVLRGLRRNLVENGIWTRDWDGSRNSVTGDSRKRPHEHKASKKNAIDPSMSSVKPTTAPVEVAELDWAECTPELLKDRIKYADSLDCIIACDCIYNESLVESFVEACVSASSQRPEAPLCVVAQQLRSDLVFEAWLKTFHRRFHTWRVSDNLLTPSLRQGSGYVVHVGVMRTVEE